MIQPGEIHVRNGNTVNINCVANGFPVPSVTWSKDDTVLINDSRTTVYEEMVVQGGIPFVKSVLQICSTEVVDSGDYNCTADNEFSKDTISFKVTVVTIILGKVDQHFDKNADNIIMIV